MTEFKAVIFPGFARGTRTFREVGDGSWKAKEEIAGANWFSRMLALITRITLA